MSRVLSVSLLAFGLFVGFAIREPRISAQGPSFPYAVGDSVRLDYPDGVTRSACVIEQVYGSFISCKSSSPAFSTPDAPPKTVYNLSTVISIQLVKRATWPQ